MIGLGATDLREPLTFELLVIRRMGTVTADLLRCALMI
jgi:hypothetical protein